MPKGKPKKTTKRDTEVSKADAPSARDAWQKGAPEKFKPLLDAKKKSGK